MFGEICYKEKFVINLSKLNLLDDRRRETLTVGLCEDIVNQDTIHTLHRTAAMSTNNCNVNLRR